MGKSLVIKGINAAPAGLGQVTLAETEIDITSQIRTIASTNAGYGTQFLHDTNNFNNAIQSTTAIPNTRFGFIDVSQYVGRTIRCTWIRGYLASDYTPPGYWKCFASAISQFSVAKTTVQNVVTAVEYISGLGAPVGGFATQEFVIPTGTVYIIFPYSLTDATNYSFAIVG
jgi:hypothetical protein